MFQCKKCGACCRKVGTTVLGILLADKDGVCKYLDRKTNLCKIYNERPIFCNVDEYYEKYLADEISKEEYYSQNWQICKKLQDDINS